MIIYQFGHLISSSRTRSGNFRTTTTQYTTQPFEFIQPEYGKTETMVHCDRCNEDVKVSVFSNKEIWKRRLKYWWIVPTCALFWFLYTLIRDTTGIGRVITEWSGILGVITFFAVVWALSKLFVDKERLMFDFDKAGHTILWNKKEKIL